MTKEWVTFDRANWWLRDVASATNFCNVNNNGNCNYNGASNSNGVRPDFGNAYKTSMIGSIQPKGKVIHAARLKDSAEMRSCCVPQLALCGEIRRTNTRGLIRKEARAL